MEHRKGTSKYTDAERAEYWKKKALAIEPAPEPKKYKAKYKKRSYVHKAHKAEPGIISAIGSAVGGGLGGLSGSPIGAPLAGFLGGKIGHLIENITGFGEYKVQSNSILRGGMPVPRIVNSINSGGTIVRHCEYIGDVLSTTAFTATTYNINPGLSSTFPWLSQIASSYEQYRMRGCIFEFRSTSSNALLSSSTSTALGTIVMGTQYDVLDPTWTDKRTMLNHEYSNSVDPSKTGIHLVECKRSLNVLSNQYTRSGAVPSDRDLHLYDLGKFTIATVGMQAAGGVLGELWVTYEVELMKQQFNIIGYQDRFTWTTWTNSNILGTDANDNYGLTPYSTLGGYISNKESSIPSYYFPRNISAGYFLLTVSLDGNNSAAAFSPPSITAVNAVLTDALGNSLHNRYAPGPVVTARVIYEVVVRVTAPGAILRYGTSAVLPVASATPTGVLMVTYLGPPGQPFLL